VSRTHKSKLHTCYGMPITSASVPGSFCRPMEWSQKLTFFFSFFYFTEFIVNLNCTLLAICTCVNYYEKSLYLY